MEYVTIERLKYLIKEARAHNQDASKYKEELAKALSREGKSKNGVEGKRARIYTKKKGNLRIYSMAQVKDSHFHGLSVDR